MFQAHILGYKHMLLEIIQASFSFSFFFSGDSRFPLEYTTVHFSRGQNLHAIFSVFLQINSPTKRDRDYTYTSGDHSYWPSSSPPPVSILRSKKKKTVHRKCNSDAALLTRYSGARIGFGESDLEKGINSLLY